jgi:predicted nucleic-acid-binding protein
MNVVVRYLTQDDPKQAAIATRLMEKTLSSDEPGFISLVVLAEVVSGLLTTEQLRVESAELVWRAKRRYEASKADFSDALIAECAVAAGCRHAVTFDRSAASTSGFELLT